MDALTKTMEERQEYTIINRQDDLNIPSTLVYCDLLFLKVLLE